MCQFTPYDDENELNCDVSERPLFFIQDSDTEDMQQPGYNELNEEQPLISRSEGAVAEPFSRIQEARLHSRTLFRTAQGDAVADREIPTSQFANFTQSRQDFMNSHRRFSCRRRRYFYRLLKKSIKYIRKSARLLRRAQRNHRRSRKLVKICFRILFDSKFS